MINRIIAWSIEQRALVMLIALAFSIAGLVSLSKTPVDAIPD